LEGLINYWGLYFVAARDGNNVGVDDLENALKDIGCHKDWTDDLKDPHSKREKNQTIIFPIEQLRRFWPHAWWSSDRFCSSPKPAIAAYFQSTGAYGCCFSYSILCLDLGPLIHL